MLFLNCKYLRRAFSLAGLLLIGGILLEVVAHLLASESHLLTLQTYALGMILFSPVLILVVMVVSLIPGINLKECMGYTR
ncbi:MAG: hypothetical protein P8171_07495 [Candidatus Thiodiazotropha sp.]|jgi:hypothetical protein